MRNGAQFKNVTSSLSADRFSGRWTTSSNEPWLTDASDIQVAAVAVSAETQPVRHVLSEAWIDPAVAGKCWPLIETARMLMLIVLGTLAVR